MFGITMTKVYFYKTVIILIAHIISIDWHPAQESHEPVRVGLDECHKNDQGAERVIIVQPGEQKALQAPYCNLCIKGA